MSVAEGTNGAVKVRKPGGFLLVFLPCLIVGIGVVALGLGQMVAAKNASLPVYGVDEVMTGAVTPDAG